MTGVVCLHLIQIVPDDGLELLLDFSFVRLHEIVFCEAGLPTSSADQI